MLPCNAKQHTPLYPRCFHPSLGCGANNFVSIGSENNLLLLMPTHSLGWISHMRWYVHTHSNIQSTSAWGIPVLRKYANPTSRHAFTNCFPISVASCTSKKELQLLSSHVHCERRTYWGSTIPEACKVDNWDCSGLEWDGTWHCVMT